MDQIKTGKFIAERRRELGLTQMQLGEMLGITDRAISKWERGKSLPDYGIILDLCNILQISVNDLLCGEVVTLDSYNDKLENNLLEMVKQKEQADKMLLHLELIVASVCVAVMLALCGFASFVEMEEWLRITLVIIGLLPVLFVTPFMIKIEQTAEYYVCKRCGHKHIPAYVSVFWQYTMAETDI